MKLLNDFLKGITTIDPFFIFSTYKNLTLIKLDNPDYFTPLSDVHVAWFCSVAVKFTDQYEEWKISMRLSTIKYQVFNDQVISYALTVVLCQLCFRNMPKRNGATAYLCQSLWLRDLHFLCWICAKDVCSYLLEKLI